MDSDMIDPVFAKCKHTIQKNCYYDSYISFESVKINLNATTSSTLFSINLQLFVLCGL